MDGTSGDAAIEERLLLRRDRLLHGMAIVGPEGRIDPATVEFAKDHRGIWRIVGGRWDGLAVKPNG